MCDEFDYILCVCSAMDTTTTFLAGVGLYNYMVTDFMRPDLLGVVPPSVVLYLRGCKPLILFQGAGGE